MESHAGEVGALMARDWQQLRLRLPPEVYEDVAAEVERKGSTMQRELLMRVLRGSRRPDALPSDAAYGVIAGEVEAIALLVENMRRRVREAARLDAEPETPDPEEGEGA